MTERDSVGFGTTIIDYSVVRSGRRRKTVEITLDPSIGVVVSAPVATEPDRIRQVVAKRAGWIIRHANDEVLQPRPKQFVSGESLPYLGRQVRLYVDHADVARARIAFDHWSFRLVVPADIHDAERRNAIMPVIQGWFVRRARERLSERTARWSARTGYMPSAVLIRDQRQRWASCSPDGTLRFNWRVVMAPPALIDYVVAHELVHMRVRSHSVDFWAELAELMPDYRWRRARLRELGPSLHL